MNIIGGVSPCYATSETLPFVDVEMGWNPIQARACVESIREAWEYNKKEVDSIDFIWHFISRAGILQVVVRTLRQ